MEQDPSQPKKRPTLDACARGGKVKATESERKAAGLAALFASRRGRRINTPGLSEADLADLMQQVRAVAEEADYPRSYNGAAHAVGVDHQTIRRWVSGVDWPTRDDCARLTLWLHQCRRVTAA